VSKHFKEASKNAGSGKTQGALFKPEAAAVNGDDIENSPRADLASETTAGPEVLNKKKRTLVCRQQLVRSISHPSAQRLACNKIEPEFETVLCSPDNKKLTVCKSRSLRISSEGELLLMQGQMKSKNNSNGKKQLHLLAPTCVPVASHQGQITDQRWKNTELCRSHKISQPEVPKKSQVMLQQQSIKCCQLPIP